MCVSVSVCVFDEITGVCATPSFGVFLNRTYFLLRGVEFVPGQQIKCFQSKFNAIVMLKML